MHHIRHARRADTVGGGAPLGQSRRHALTQWLSTIPVLPYPVRDDDPVVEDVARMWGAISGRALIRGMPRPTNDSWIAACCLIYQLPLATLNAKDFKDYSEHEGLELLTL